MPRIRFGRISAAVAALCLTGAIQHAEDISATVYAVDTDGAAVPGEVRVTLDDFPVIAGTRLPFAGGQFTELGPIRCAADARRQRRVCTSREPTENSYSAGMTMHRSSNGASQLDFDGLTTDTVFSRMAMVRRGTDRAGHATDLALRSTQRWDGVAPASARMTVNGADTTYSAVQYASGVNRHMRVVTYSDVRLTRHPSSIARDFPSGGIMVATTTDEWVTPSSTRPSFSRMIVYFDGTRRPDAYLDGKAFRLDLQTGQAIPKIVSN